VLVARIRAVDPIEANTAGPSRGEDGSRKAMKGKAREVRAREEGAATDEEWALRRRMVSEAVVRKKIEIEMMIGELAGLERLLEE
jgi:hypothetical protein